MHWARRLRWQAAAPAVAALAAVAAAALPAAARTAGPAAPGPGSFVAPLAGATPAVAVWKDPLFEGFMYDYTGSDRHVYQVFPTPNGEESAGGALVGGPGLVFVSPGHGTALFARGTNSAVYQNTGTSWQSLGGVLTSRPGVAAGALSVSGGEAVDAVIRGSDGAVWDRELTTAAGPWRGLGGRVLAGSGPAAVNVGGTLYVLIVGTDGAVWVRHSTDGVVGAADEHDPHPRRRAGGPYVTAAAAAQRMPAGPVGVVGALVGPHRSVGPQGEHIQGAADVHRRRPAARQRPAA